MVSFKREVCGGFLPLIYIEQSTLPKKTEKKNLDLVYHNWKPFLFLTFHTRPNAGTKPKPELTSHA